MAKIKKDIKTLRNSKVKIRIASWVENKIASVRSLSKHQASRAAKRYGAPAGVSLLLLFGLYSTFFPNRFEKAKIAILKNPENIEARFVLAEEYLKNNMLDKAEKELLNTQKLSNQENKHPRVLGFNSKLEELWQKWQEQDPEEIKKEIAKWEKFLAKTPTYRDGWLYLAFYHFKLGNREKAETALEKAKELDLLNENVRNLERIIKL